MDMLQERYQDESSSRLEEHSVTTSKGHLKPIEFVGHDKIMTQQQLTRLTQVSLRSMGIAHVPDDDDDDDANLFDSVQHLQQIDIAGNLLSDWADVDRLLRHFGNLRHLSLACNRLRLDSTQWLAQQSTRVYDNLQHLNVRGSVVHDYKTLLQLLRVVPKVQELCCAMNDLSDMVVALQANEVENGAAMSDATTTVFPCLTWLDVSACRLDSQAISALAKQFPNVAWLSLDDNDISEWPADASFAQLEHVQLVHTQISNWMDLEPMNRLLPKLQSLSLRKCPLLADWGELQTRAVVIARFPSLQKFNGAIVTPQERQDAERQYLLTTSRSLQLALAEYHTSGGADKLAEPTKTQFWQEELLAKHPQYSRLLEKYPDLSSRVSHGDVAVTATNENVHGNAGASSSLLLADSMVSVQIRSMSAQSCTMEPLLRRLPGRLTVGRVKALCCRQFGLPVDLQNLMMRPSSSSLPTPLDDNDRSLDYYGVSDGAEILVHEIDERHVELERKRAQQDLESRIDEQQAQLEQFQLQKKLAARQ